MSAIKGKHILLGITGGIAAYKAAYLTRLFIKNGAEVRVLMTPNAKQFITPLTLATLSKNPVFTEFFDAENGNWNSHVDLGMWADAMIIAPATASTMGKMANGIADNLLVTSYLSARCPVFVAPAMDLDMYKHPSTKENIEKLKGFGNYIIEPTAGELASGLTGEGRMEEPDKIFSFVEDFFYKSNHFKGKKVLITAGPTYEAIDPVRFIGNHSSGKMGLALAESFHKKGADVILIHGPIQAEIKSNFHKIIPVTSAEEMHNAAISEFSSADIAIMAAAVADYKPVSKSETKIKRTSENMQITLEANPDIAASLGEMKNENQILVGFALETNNEQENAQKKLLKKNLDIIILNSLNDKGAGFKTDTNKITILDKNNKKLNFELKSKTEVAEDIVNYIKNF